MKRWKRQRQQSTLTDTAAEKIRDLVAAAETASRSLRDRRQGRRLLGLPVRAGARFGQSDDDEVFEHNGVAVVVDKVSMQFVFGSEVDYVDGLQGAGFTVNNPNVVAACGCGSSFQVREDAAEQAAAV